MQKSKSCIWTSLQSFMHEEKQMQVILFRFMAIVGYVHKIICCLQVPNAGAAFLGIFFYVQPKGGNQVKNNRRTQGKEARVNKRESHAFGRNIHCFAELRANSEERFLYGVFD